MIHLYYGEIIVDNFITILWRHPILSLFCIILKSATPYDVINLLGKRKGRGEENLFKRDGRKGGFLTIIG